jgi:hypothetical protein
MVKIRFGENKISYYYVVHEFSREYVQININKIEAIVM